MKIKLAEALLRRKELNEKVEQLKKINVQNLFEVKVQRKNVTDNIDDIIALVPRITLAQEGVTISHVWVKAQGKAGNIISD